MFEELRLSDLLSFYVAPLLDKDSNYFLLQVISIWNRGKTTYNIDNVLETELLKFYFSFNMLTPIALMTYRNPVSIPVINKLFMNCFLYCHLTLLKFYTGNSHY